MPRVFFRKAGESDAVVEARSGLSLMQVALNNGLNGILGECGGSCQCATCHVYVEAAWLPTLAEMDDMEDEMLEGAISPRLPQSRLGCCVTLTDEHDGIVVDFPPEQA